MFIRDCWYVAAWGHEVSADILLGRHILDERVVLFRDEKGQAVALEDRCPHRLAPLSRGRREQGRLRCMYHGLVFDGSGRCVAIPGQETIPPELKARAYPVVERDTMIWIWTGDADKADPAAVPDCRLLSDPGWNGSRRYSNFRADYSLVVDNLLDFSHLSFVHEKTLGGSGAAAEMRPEIKRFDWGVHVAHWHFSIPLPPYMTAITPFEGLVDRWLIYDWLYAGNVLRMDAGFAPAGTGAREGNRASGTIQHGSVQCLTPESEGSTHYFWCSLRDYRLEDQDLSERHAEQVRAAFEEDRAMIEAQQQVLRESPGRAMNAVNADLAALHVRRLIARRIEAAAKAQLSGPSGS